MKIRAELGKFLIRMNKAGEARKEAWEGHVTICNPVEPARTTPHAKMLLVNVEEGQ